MKAALDYIREVRLELSKVVWPSKKEVIKLTLTVIIFSSIVGVYVGLLDFTFTKLLELLVTR